MSTGSQSALCLSELISELAKQGLLNPDFIRSQARAAGLSSWGMRRLTKTTIELAKDFRLRGQLGRLRAALLLGTSVVGEPFVTALERNGILLSDDQTIEKFGRFLEGLRTELDAAKAADWK